MSERHLRDIQSAHENPPASVRVRIKQAIAKLRTAEAAMAPERERLIGWAKEQRKLIGLRKLADALSFDHANLGKNIGWQSQSNCCSLRKLA